MESFSKVVESGSAPYAVVKCALCQIEAIISSEKLTVH